MNWLERLNQGPGKLALGQGMVEVLHWAHRDHLPDNRPHRHTYFEACLVGTHGMGQFLVPPYVCDLKPGTVFFARPGVAHQIINTRRPDMELFWVAFQWIPSLESTQDEVDGLMRIFAQSSVIATPDQQGRMAALWQAMRTLAEGNTVLAGMDTQLMGLKTALLISIAQLGAGLEAPRMPETSAWEGQSLTARLAMRYIHDNLGQTLPILEIAQHAHTSPRNLSRAFATFAGISPAAYIVRARIDRAQGLLLHSDLPTKEIAAQVGYTDVHHFTRAFSRIVGVPPGEFRRHGVLSVPNIQKPGALV